MSLRQTPRAVGWAAAIALAMPAAGAEDELVFTFRHRTDQVERLRVESRVFGSMKMFESMPEQPFAQTYAQDIENRLLQVNPDGSGDYETAITRVRMKMSMMGMNMEFDSAAPASQPAAPGLDVAARLFQGMAGIRFRTTLGPNGEPLKMEGLREAMATALQGMGTLGAVEKQMLDQIMSGITDDAMMENMRGAYRSYVPGGRARIGHTWEHTWELKLPLPMGNRKLQGRGRYELVGVEEVAGRRCAKVRYRQSFETAPGPAAASGPSGSIMDRMKMEFSMTDGQGVAYWDFSCGQLVSQQDTARLTIQMTMTPDPGAADQGLAAGMKMTQNLQVATSVRLLNGDGGEPAGAAPASVGAP